MKATWVPTDRGTGKEDVVYIHNEIFFGNKKKE